MTPAMNAALSALDALGKKLGVTANNLANVNTEGFKRSRAVLQEGNPSGVTISISRVDSPGSYLASEDRIGKIGETSNVDLAEEIVNLKTTNYGYLANLKTIEAEDEILGSLFDILA